MIVSTRLWNNCSVLFTFIVLKGYGFPILIAKLILIVYTQKSGVLDVIIKITYKSFKICLWYNMLNFESYTSYITSQNIKSKKNGILAVPVKVI
jgi:hypothetical protein